MKELLVTVLPWTVLAFLLTSMLEVGLSLTPAQVLAPLRDWPLVLRALLANLLIVPLLAVGIAKVARLEQPFAIGLLLLGLAPGAPFIPKIVQMARGNLPFATGLMALLMVGTVAGLPMLLPRVVAGANVNVWQIEKSLLLLMLLPLFIGLAVHSRFAVLPTSVPASLGFAANLAGVVALALLVTLNARNVLSLFGTGAIFAGALFVVLSAFTGWLLGGPDQKVRETLGFGTGARNVAAALLVASQNFENAKISVMVIVTGLVSLMLLLPAATLLSRRAQPVPLPLHPQLTDKNTPNPPVEL